MSEIARIAAVITALAPSQRLVEMAIRAASQTECVYVIDNTEGGMDTDVREALADLNKVRLVGVGHNLGLASALNRGLEACREAGFELALLLDQDSGVSPTIVVSLVQHLDDQQVAAVGPAPWDAKRGAYIDPRARWRPDLSERPAIITSGMIVRVAIATSIGGFREDFFVDCVDQDFCLRLRSAGYRILQDRRILLPHELGSRSTERFLGFPVVASHHETWRLYWVFRNGLILTRENWRKSPLWVVTNVLLLVRWLLLTVLYEGPRRTRLRAIAAGCKHALSGQVDPAYLPAGASRAASDDGHDTGTPFGSA
jgi:rhamnosyltransferase